LTVAALGACRKPTPANLADLLRAMPEAYLREQTSFPPTPDLLVRRVNLQGQIRTAIVLAPNQELAFPTSPAPLHFAIGLLPQSWERLARPVRFQLRAGPQVIWQKVLDPARDLTQRGWQEVELAPGNLPAEARLATDAADFGALVTEPHSSQEPARPAVIFILVDALRPSHLSAYGYSRPTSPNLDALAQSGVRFDNAVTASVFTLTSVASIFTGVYPWEHGVIFTRNLHLPASLPVLAEKFQQAGYLTAAFSGTYFRLSLEGFDRGFDVFDESCAQEFFRNSADCLNRAVLPWLRAHRDEPFFLYLHYVDTHAPYYAPEPFGRRFTGTDHQDHDAAGLGDAARFGDGRQWYQIPLRVTPDDLAYLKDLYDGEVAYADARIGEVLRQARAGGPGNSPLILVTADHGEALMEHGELEHRKVLYDETLKVPLILAGPGLPAGKVVSEQVRTLDFGPTLLDLAQAQSAELGRGKSLRPLAFGAAWTIDPAYATAHLGGQKVISAIRLPKWKFIERSPGGARELYDLTRDPAEKVNLAPRIPPEIERLIRNLDNR
jgi:arylsulfatase A-like enzyme